MCLRNNCYLFIIKVISYKLPQMGFLWLHFLPLSDSFNNSLNAAVYFYLNEWNKNNRLWRLQFIFDFFILSSVYCSVLEFDMVIAQRIWKGMIKLIKHQSFFASSIVSGSFLFRVSGNRKTMNPDNIAVPPNMKRGSDGKNWPCSEKKERQCLQ